MFTHSKCEISQSWRTQFSSHGAFNLNRADMPLLPLLGFPDHGSIALAATRDISKATESGQLKHELWLVEVVDGTHWLRDEVAPHFGELKESLDIFDGSGVQGCTALQLVVNWDQTGLRMVPVNG